MTQLMYESTEGARAANIGYHLVPAEIWAASASREFYTPEAYDADGFIHLTLGAEEMLAVANRFYTGDPRQFQLLVLDLGRVGAEIRYEDPGKLYPHIYGELNTSAVIGTLGVERNEEGTFTQIVPDR